VADPAVEHVVAVDVAPIRPTDDKVQAHRVDITSADLAPLVERADVLVHLALDADTELRRGGAARVNIGGTRRLLEAATEAEVPHVVVVTSAMVYGAWPNNPLPMTEEAPLRPNPELAFAVQRAQVEQLVADWVDARPGRTAAVLRPCTPLAGGGSWVATALAAASGLTPSEDDPPKQFVHLDDLAAAVDLARRDRLDGPFDVAPDGWIPSDTVRALRGAPPRLRLPTWLGGWVARARWRIARGPIPPGLIPYTIHPWVVANDRITAAGWRPHYTNEEAYVAGTEARWWTLLSPKRKQELALGAVAGLAGAATVAAVAGTRAVLRRRGVARRG